MSEKKRNEYNSVGIKEWQLIAENLLNMAKKASLGLWIFFTGVGFFYLYSYLNKFQIPMPFNSPFLVILVFWMGAISFFYICMIIIMYMYIAIIPAFHLVENKHKHKCNDEIDYAAISILSNLVINTIALYLCILCFAEDNLNVALFAIIFILHVATISFSVWQISKFTSRCKLPFKMPEVILQLSGASIFVFFIWIITTYLFIKVSPQSEVVSKESLIFIVASLCTLLIPLFVIRAIRHFKIRRFEESPLVTGIQELPESKIAEDTRKIVFVTTLALVILISFTTLIPGIASFIGQKALREFGLGGGIERRYVFESKHLGDIPYSFVSDCEQLRTTPDDKSWRCQSKPVRVIFDTGNYIFYEHEESSQNSEVYRVPSKTMSAAFSKKRSKR